MMTLLMFAIAKIQLPDKPLVDMYIRMYARHELSIFSFSKHCVLWNINNFKVLVAIQYVYATAHMLANGFVTKINHHHSCITHIVYNKTFEGGNFCDFSLNRECFPTNYGLVDWQCKSTSMLARKFSCEWQFCALTAKVFPLESFAIYGN